MVLGSLIGAIGGIAGGLLQAKGAKDQTRMAIQANKTRIQDTVRDAKAAGIHPLYALGSGAPTYSPASYSGDYGLAQAGQHLGRAAQAAMNPEDKGATQQAQSLLLEKGRLENDLLKVQIMDAQKRLTNQPGNPPGVTVGPGVNTMDPKNISKVAGQKIQHSPAWSSAQDLEDRYGDLVSLPGGVGILIADLLKTYGPTISRPRAPRVRVPYKSPSAFNRSIKSDMQGFSNRSKYGTR